MFGIVRMLCWVGLAASLFLARCAPLPGDQMARTAEGFVQISESGTGLPVVVFESGLMSYKEEWNKVFTVLAAENQVFAYDRPGIAGSTPTGRPRDGATIVEDLRQLLHGRGLPPPYVLVGHSAGGLYMQLYARRYQDEVAGLVLVDSTHPTQFVGDGAMQNRSWISNSLVGIAITGTSKAEFEALTETGIEVLSSPSIRSEMPISILIAPDKSDNAIARFDNEKRRDLARLYPGAQMREIDCSHDVPQVCPRAVIDAVQQVLRQIVPPSVPHL